MGEINLHANEKKTLFIGMDGATWDVIKPLIEEGKLPNIAKLKKEGASGILLSTEIMISPSVWTSILTGKIAGKHGILDFMTMQNHLKAKRIWEIFEDTGKITGIAGFLMTWPPKLKNEGFLIPDHFAPNGQAIPEDVSFFWEITHNRLKKTAFGFLESVYFMKKLLKYGVDFRTLINAINVFFWRIITKPVYLDYFHREIKLFQLLLEKIFLTLCNKYNPDFAAIYYPGTDVTAHKYWCYYKPDDFEEIDENDIKKYGNIIPEQYIAVDQSIGRLIKQMERKHKNLDIIIVSDHGFQSSTEAKYHPSVKIDFLLEHFQLKDQITYTKLGHNTILHAKAVTKQGQLNLLKQFEEKIKQVRDVRKDIPLFETEYIEEYLKVAAEPMWKGYQFSDAITIGQQQYKVENVLEKGVLLTGKHARKGIIIIKSQDVKPGHKIQNATVFDVTPTILALNKMPIAKDMDGKILKDIFIDSFFKDFPSESIDSYGSPEDISFSKQDFEIVKENEDDLVSRLQNLGYMD